MKKDNVAWLHMFVFVVLIPILGLSSCRPEEEVEISVPDGYVNYFIENLSFGNASDEAKVAFHINVDWKMQVVLSDDNSTNWCSVEPGSGNAGLHKVIVRVAANENNESRSARIHLMCQGNKVAEIVVAQAASLKYEAVDLGLSVKWASCNVGATSPEDYGGYYAWGETEEKSDYTWNTYKYWNDMDGDGDVDKSEITNIGSNISGTSYDVAHVKWGGDWRMPTLDEITELCNKCSWKLTAVNGVSGQKVTGPNGNSIFLPAAGICYGTKVEGSGEESCFWSGSLDELIIDAYYLRSYEAKHYWDYSFRRNGHTVRPVTK